MPDAMDAIVELLEERRALDIAAARTPRRLGSLTCEDCDALIPEARRAAMPSATRCIRCQEEAEASRGR
nr:TraR/DksA C4-type zinc finger protein [uncultured Roseococcus sp.]